MLLLKKEQSSNICDYAPIAKALYRMDNVTEKRIKKKFDVAYLMDSFQQDEAPVQA